MGRKNQSSTIRKQTANLSTSELNDRRLDITTRLTQQKQLELERKKKLELIQQQQIKTKQQQQQLLYEQRSTIFETEHIFSRVHNLESSIQLLTLSNFDTIFHDVVRLINSSMDNKKTSTNGNDVDFFGSDNTAFDLFGGDFNTTLNNESVINELTTKHPLFTTGVPITIATQYKTVFSIFGIELTLKNVSNPYLTSNTTSFVPKGQITTLTNNNIIIQHVPEVEDQTKLTTQRTTPYTFTEYQSALSNTNMNINDKNNNSNNGMNVTTAKPIQPDIDTNPFLQQQYAILTNLPKSFVLPSGQSKDLKKSNVLVQRFKQFGSEQHDNVDMKSIFQLIHSLHLTKFESELTPALLDTCFTFKDNINTGSINITGSNTNITNTNTTTHMNNNNNISNLTLNSNTSTNNTNNNTNITNGPTHVNNMSLPATNTTTINHYIPQTTTGLLYTSTEYQQYKHHLKEQVHKTNLANQNIFLTSISTLKDMRDIGIYNQIHQHIMPSTPLDGFLLPNSYRLLISQLTTTPSIMTTNPIQSSSSSTSTTNKSSSTSTLNQTKTSFLLDTLPSIFNLPQSLRLPTDPTLFNLHHALDYTLNLQDKTQSTSIASIMGTSSTHNTTLDTDMSRYTKQTAFQPSIDVLHQARNLLVAQQNYHQQLLQSNTTTPISPNSTGNNNNNLNINGLKHKYHNSHILPKINTIGVDNSSTKIAQCISLLTYLNMHSSGRCLQYITKQVNVHLSPKILESQINSLITIHAVPVITTNLLTSNNNTNTMTSKNTNMNNNSNNNSSQNIDQSTAQSPTFSLASSPVEYRVEIDYNGFVQLEHKILFLTELYNSGLYTDIDSYYNIISTLLRTLFTHLEAYSSRLNRILKSKTSVKYLQFHHYHTPNAMNSIGPHSYLVSRFEYHVYILGIFRLLNVWLNRIPEFAQIYQLKLASNLWNQYSKYTLLPSLQPKNIVAQNNNYNKNDGKKDKSNNNNNNSKTISEQIMSDTTQSPIEKLAALQQYEHKLYLTTLPQLLCTQFGQITSTTSIENTEYDLFGTTLSTTTKDNGRDKDNIKKDKKDDKRDKKDDKKDKKSDSTSTNSSNNKKDKKDKKTDDENKKELTQLNLNAMSVLFDDSETISTTTSPNQSNINTTDIKTTNSIPFPNTNLNLPTNLPSLDIPSTFPTTTHQLPMLQMLSDSFTTTSFQQYLTKINTFKEQLPKVLSTMTNNTTTTVNTSTNDKKQNVRSNLDIAMQTATNAMQSTSNTTQSTTSTATTNVISLLSSTISFAINPLSIQPFKTLTSIATPSLSTIITQLLKLHHDILLQTNVWNHEKINLLSKAQHSISYRGSISAQLVYDYKISSQNTIIYSRCLGLLNDLFGFPTIPLQTYIQKDEQENYLMLLSNYEKEVLEKGKFKDNMEKSFYEEYDGFIDQFIYEAQILSKDDYYDESGDDDDENELPTLRTDQQLQNNKKNNNNSNEINDINSFLNRDNQAQVDILNNNTYLTGSQSLALRQAHEQMNIDTNNDKDGLDYVTSILDQLYKDLNKPSDNNNNSNNKKSTSKDKKGSSSSKKKDNNKTSTNLDQIDENDSDDDNNDYGNGDIVGSLLSQIEYENEQSDDEDITSSNLSLDHHSVLRIGGEKDPKLMKNSESERDKKLKLYQSMTMNPTTPKDDEEEIEYDDYGNIIPIKNKKTKKEMKNEKSANKTMSNDIIDRPQDPSIIGPLLDGVHKACLPLSSVVSQRDFEHVMRSILTFTRTDFNSKSTQKRIKVLLQYILALKPIMADRFPYYVRIVAMLQSKCPLLTQGFVDIVIRETQSSIAKCKVLGKNDNSLTKNDNLLNFKLKWIRLFLECIKFGLIPAGYAFTIWIECITINTTYSLFLLMSFLEHIGTWLYCNTDTYNLCIQMINTTNTMINRRKIQGSKVHLVNQALSFCVCYELISLNNGAGPSGQGSGGVMSTTSGNATLDNIYNEDLLTKYIKYTLKQVLDDEITFQSAVQIFRGLPWNNDLTSHYDNIIALQASLQQLKLPVAYNPILSKDKDGNQLPTPADYADGLINSNNVFANDLKLNQRYETIYATNPILLRLQQTITQLEFQVYPLTSTFTSISTQHQQLSQLQQFLISNYQHSLSDPLSPPPPSINDIKLILSKSVTTNKRGQLVSTLIFPSSQGFDLISIFCQSILNLPVLTPTQVESLVEFVLYLSSGVSDIAPVVYNDTKSTSKVQNTSQSQNSNVLSIDSNTPLSISNSPMPPILHYFVDSLLQSIMDLLSANQLTTRSERLQQLHILGLLVSKNALSINVLFSTLYYILNYGFTMSKFGLICPSDPPQDTFRIAMILELISTCTNIIFTPLVQPRFEVFLLFFQRYLTLKGTIPLHMELKVQELYDNCYQNEKYVQNRILVDIAPYITSTALLGAPNPIHNNNTSSSTTIDKKKKNNDNIFHGVCLYTGSAVNIFLDAIDTYNYYQNYVASTSIPQQPPIINPIGRRKHLVVLHERPTTYKECTAQIMLLIRERDMFLKTLATQNGSNFKTNPIQSLPQRPTQSELRQKNPFVNIKPVQHIEINTESNIQLTSQYLFKIKMKYKDLNLIRKEPQFDATIIGLDLNEDYFQRQYRKNNNMNNTMVNDDDTLLMKQAQQVNTHQQQSGLFLSQNNDDDGALANQLTAQFVHNNDTDSKSDKKKQKLSKQLSTTTTTTTTQSQDDEDDEDDDDDDDDDFDTDDHNLDDELVQNVGDVTLEDLDVLKLEDEDDEQDEDDDDNTNNNEQQHNDERDQDDDTNEDDDNDIQFSKDKINITPEMNITNKNDVNDNLEESTGIDLDSILAGINLDGIVGDNNNNDDEDYDEDYIDDEDDEDHYDARKLLAQQYKSYSNYPTTTNTTTATSPPTAITTTVQTKSSTPIQQQSTIQQQQPIQQQSTIQQQQPQQSTQPKTFSLSSKISQSQQSQQQQSQSKKDLQPASKEDFEAFELWLRGIERQRNEDYERHQNHLRGDLQYNVNTTNMSIKELENLIQDENTQHIDNQSKLTEDTARIARRRYGDNSTKLTKADWELEHKLDKLLASNGGVLDLNLDDDISNTTSSTTTTTTKSNVPVNPLNRKPRSDRFFQLQQFITNNRTNLEHDLQQIRQNALLQSQQSEQNNNSNNNNNNKQQQQTIGFKLLSKKLEQGKGYHDLHTINMATNSPLIKNWLHKEIKRYQTNLAAKEYTKKAILKQQAEANKDELEALQSIDLRLMSDAQHRRGQFLDTNNIKVYQTTTTTIKQQFTQSTDYKKGYGGVNASNTDPSDTEILTKWKQYDSVNKKPSSSSSTPKKR